MTGDTSSASGPAGPDRAPVEAPGPTPASTSWPVAPPVAPPPLPRRGLLVALTGGVVGMVALAATLVVVLGGSTNANAAVVRSVQSTLADRSADVAITLEGTGAGQDITGTGSGALDFADNAAQLHLDMTADGRQLGIDEIVTGQTVYIGGTFGGAGLDTLYPGKSWMSIDLGSLQSALGQSPSALGGSTNPSVMLRLLAQHGANVASLGSSTVDGTTVQGYAVTFDPATMRAELASPSLPAWLRQATAQVDFGHLAMKVYVDGSGLLRELDIDTQVSAAGTSVSLSETLDFSDFGTAIDVTAPPADEVVPLSQVLQGAGATSGI